MGNLARKGPRQVWEDYKTMRVPIEIFDEVKKFMDRRKQEYLAQQMGLDLKELELPAGPDFSYASSPSREEMTNIIKAAIREELQGGGLAKAEMVEIPPPTLTSQERVKQLLMQRPNETLTTLQIGQMLDMPNSTAREATRTIADDVSAIKKIPGRPNKFIYEPEEQN